MSPALVGGWQEHIEFVKSKGILAAGPFADDAEQSWSGEGMSWVAIPCPASSGIL